jgi:hypothetical protein
MAERGRLELPPDMYIELREVAEGRNVPERDEVEIFHIRDFTLVLVLQEGIVGECAGWSVGMGLG